MLRGARGHVRRHCRAERDKRILRRMGPVGRRARRNQSSLARAVSPLSYGRPCIGTLFSSPWLALSARGHDGRAAIPVRWRWAVALVLLTTLIVASGPQLLWETLRTANLAWALAAACLLVPWFMLGVVNVWLLVRRLAPLPFGTFVKVYAASWASSIVLPGQMGDATQIPLLRRYGVPVSASSAAYVTDKTLSLAFMVVVAILGIVVYLLVQLNGRWVAPVAAAGLLALLRSPELSLPRSL